MMYKPNEQDEYYIIEPDGEITTEVWYSLSYDYGHLYMGNCFETREEAEAHKDEILEKYKI